MDASYLRKVGESIMLSIPDSFVNQLNLKDGGTISMSIVGGRLVVAPAPRIRYTLAELLAECDCAQPISDEESEWINAQGVGNELL